MKIWRIPVLGITLLCLGAVSGVAQTVELMDGAPTDQPGFGAAEVAPAAPSKLQALALRTDRLFLIWEDNSNNETNFRIEARTGGGAFSEVGTTPGNNIGVFISNLDPATTYQFRVRASNGDGNSAYSNVATVTTRTTNACTGSSTEMCLNNNRFRVQALYQTSGDQNGQAGAVELTVDSGYLWFFDDTNIEAVVKVLNACSFNDRYWVFAAGLTNVRVALAVTDTELLTSRVYVNALNTAFPPIQDTDALQSCP